MDAVPLSEVGEFIPNSLLRLMRRNSRVHNAITAGFALIGLPLLVFALWAFWAVWGVDLWRWVSGASSDGLAGLGRGLGAGLAYLVLGGVSAVLIVFFFGGFGEILGIYTEDALRVATAPLRKASSEQERVEEELKQVDKTGLVLLLRYSRVQLEQYYSIGLTQTQRSFRYGVIAMWIGFAVILMSLVIQSVELEGIGIRPISGSAGTLSLASGIVIEAISALFIWLYRRSLKQLTYFYDRQMYNHNIIMCHRIAETMHQSEATKHRIVEHMLLKSWSMTDDLAQPKSGGEVKRPWAKPKASVSPPPATNP